MTSSWGWTPPRPAGIWRHGHAGLRPFVAAAPYITVGLLLLLMHFLSGTLTASEGVLFDLPDAAPTDAVGEAPVALMVPVARDTLVFFDDTRYLMGDESSMRALGEQLSERFARGGDRPLLVLADRRVPGGDLMRLAALAKAGGVPKVLFAEKRAETGE